MTDTASTKTRKRPEFTVYFLQDRDNAPWVPIGAAWEHQDNNGFNLKLDLLPNVPGRVVLRRVRNAGEQS